MIGVGDTVLVRYVPNMTLEEDLIFEDRTYYIFGKVISVTNNPEMGYFNVKAFENKYNLYTRFDVGDYVLTQAIYSGNMSKAVLNCKLNKALYSDYAEYGDYLVDLTGKEEWKEELKK